MSHCQPECGVDPCNNPPPVDAANETLESTVNNFITEFFGTVTKSVVDNRVVWALPCDLDTGLPGFPRTENVGLACYFLDLFVDLAAQVASGGILPQLAVRQATTANITLSGEQTIDGVLTSASRVLVKNQTLSKNNGIYVTGAGAWTRATDADIVAELQVKNYYFVTNGTTQGGTGWTITTAPVVLGTDPIVFTQFNALSSYTAGSGLSLAGTVFSLDTSIAMLRSANLSDLANKVTAQINLLPNQLGHAGEALLTDGVNVSWGPVATADSTARSKADSAALVASAATSQNVAQSSLISTNTVAVSTADSKAVAASTADSSNLATSNSQNTSQSVLISTATSAAAVADSKAASNSTLISSNTVAISVADSKAVSDSVVISTNLATTGSQNTSQSTLISTADSKATSVAAGGTTTDSTARSMATSVATVEASDNTAAQSRDTSQSVLISTATANASIADSKAVSDSAIISTNLSLGSSQNTSQSTLISTADSKAVSATGNSVDSIARSQATSVATVESTDASTAVSRDLSQSTLISVADSKGTSAAGNSNDSIARSQATSVATTESSDYSASNSKDVSQSVLISVATINASAADSKAVSVSLVVSANLATANTQDTTQSTNISATDSRATSAASVDASANASQSLLISTATSAAVTADSKAVSDSVVISTNLSLTNSQNTSQSTLISTATTNASIADSKAVSDSTVISSNLATSGSQNTSQSVLISTATTAASTADSKAVSDSVGMSVTDSKATSLSTGFSAANSQALVDSASISGGTSSLTSSDVSQSVLISTATSKADSASGNSNDSVARSMATSAATLAGSQNTSQSTLVSTATTNASTADSKAVAVSTADSSNLVTSNSQNTSQSILISTATSAAATADSKALSDSVVISSNLQIGNSQNTSQSTLISTADSKATSTALRVAGIQSRMVNVKDPAYGAVGNGSTDDTAAIALAVAALTDNSCLYFPPGKYVLSTGGITISSVSNVLITGDAAEIYNNVGANQNTLVVNPTCQYITVSNLKFTSVAATRGTGVVIRLYSNYSTVTNCVIVGGGEFGILLTNESSGVNVGSTVISNRLYSTYGDGIHVGSATEANVIGNTLYNTGDDSIGVVTDILGFSPARVNILDNLIYNAGGNGSSGCGIRVAEASDVLVRGNSIFISKEAGIYVTRYQSTSAFNARIVIEGNKINAACSLSGPRGSIWLEWLQGCTVTGNKIDDPSNGAGISFLDCNDLVISNNQLRAIPIRGIASDDSTTTNVAANCYRVWIMDNQILYLFANESIYVVPASGKTINDIVISGNAGGAIPSGNWIYYDRVTGGRVYNNLNLLSRAVAAGGTVSGVTAGNNN